jgi:IS30 family transposase
MAKNTSKEGKKYRHLSLKDREEIADGLRSGMKQDEIAALINRSPSTISREIKRNSPWKNKLNYRATFATAAASLRMKNKPARQRIPNIKLRSFIIKNLEKGYSPEIIVFLVSKENNRWKTNHETIYQWIYSDRRDLIPFLVKSHRKRRKRSSANQKRNIKVPNRTMIDKRPEYINLRKQIGDWETDTIVSRQSKEAVMVLVNRKSRVTILKKLTQKTALLMHKAQVKSLKDFSAKLRNSITYDNGTENALHELTNTVLGTKSYFCNPYHSGEKGTVENIIGIVRRFYPKKTNWKNVSQWDLNKTARFINNRPLKCLHFKTPLQVHVALAS